MGIRTSKIDKWKKTDIVYEHFLSIHRVLLWDFLYLLSQVNNIQSKFLHISCLKSSRSRFFLGFKEVSCYQRSKPGELFVRGDALCHHHVLRYVRVAINASRACNLLGAVASLSDWPELHK